MKSFILRARRGICLGVGTDRRRILGKRVGGQCETASLAKKELSVRKDISDAAAMMTQPSLRVMGREDRIRLNTRVGWKGGLSVGLVNLVSLWLTTSDPTCLINSRNLGTTF